MTLVPKDFFDEPSLLFPFETMRDRMRRLWDDGRWAMHPLSEDETLAVDLVRDEEKGEIVVTAALPGFDKDEVSVELEGGALQITAQHREDVEEKTAHYYRRECHYGALRRRIRMPEAVTEGKTAAELKNGVLTVRVPLAENANPRQIDVTVA